MNDEITLLERELQNWLQTQELKFTKSPFVLRSSEDDKDIEIVSSLACAISLQEFKQEFFKSNLDFSGQLNWKFKLSPRQYAGSAQPIANVRNLLAIASGKGGVGKSTVAANLAVALCKQGYRVGLLDADVYGPSVPVIFGLDTKAQVDDRGRLIPLSYRIDANNELSLMSIGFLVDSGSAMIWRGPMVSKALNQMLYQCAWPELDILLLDLPPGTGDVQLTLAKNSPLTAAVLISTPDKLSWSDVRRASNMFTSLQVDTLGLLENMTYVLCDDCGHKTYLGEKNYQAQTLDNQLSCLAQLPFVSSLRSGINVQSLQQNTLLDQAFLKLALQISALLVEKKKRTVIPLNSKN